MGRRKLLQFQNLEPNKYLVGTYLPECETLNSWISAQKSSLLLVKPSSFPCKEDGLVWVVTRRTAEDSFISRYFWDSLGGELPCLNSVIPQVTYVQHLISVVFNVPTTCINLRLALNCNSPFNFTVSKDIHDSQHKPSLPLVCPDLFFSLSRLTLAACHSKLHMQWSPSQRWFLYHLNCKDNSKKPKFLEFRVPGMTLNISVDIS